MKLSVDYGFYKDNYGGNLIPSYQIFNRISMKSMCFINKITFNKINDDNITDEIRLGICAVTDEMFKIEKTGGIKTVESVGYHSVSYKVDNITEEKQYIKTAKIYIPGEYFYRGIY